MEIGVIAYADPKKEKYFDKMAQFGLHVAQLACWESEIASRERADSIVDDTVEKDIRICAVWGG